MPANTIMIEIAQEVKRAKSLRPTWPDHPAAQAGIVCAAVGRLMKVCLQWKYARANEGMVQEAQRERIRNAAIHCGAMVFRFLENLK